MFSVCSEVWETWLRALHWGSLILPWSLGTERGADMVSEFRCAGLHGFSFQSPNRDAGRQPTVLLVEVGSPSCPLTHQDPGIRPGHRSASSGPHTPQARGTLWPDPPCIPWEVQRALSKDQPQAAEWPDQVIFR